MNYLHAIEVIKHAPRAKVSYELKRLSSEMEEDWLLRQSISEEAFLFLIYIFSDETVTSSKELSKYVRVLFTDFEKITSEQAQKLLSVFIENSQRYLNELTCFSVADLIARKFSNSISMDAFRRVVNLKSQQSNRFAYFGLDVLRVRSEVGSEVEEMVVTMQKEIEAWGQV